MKKAFTLAETVIVLVIVSLLAGLIIQSYLTVSKLTFVVEQKKILTEESLMLTQIFDSLFQTAQIDYEKYGNDLV